MIKVGDRVYYTGDMANCPSYGTVTAYHPRTQYRPESVSIKHDDERFEGDTERFSRYVPIIAFKPHPGRRFWLASEYDADRQAQTEAFAADLRARGIC